jgi:pyruvate dehydrogenase E2 component (dihydrolipoamide acetyltransferase)
MSIMRTKIAEHMVISKRTSAHVTTVHRVDMTKVAKLRAGTRTRSAALRLLAYLSAVRRRAPPWKRLRQFPIRERVHRRNNIIYHNEINIGIAVALENGLIVPVIRNADEKNVLGLQRSIVDLATRARSRQLKPDEVQGGTFSITNFGSFGSVFRDAGDQSAAGGDSGRGHGEKRCRSGRTTPSRFARNAIWR